MYNRGKEREKMMSKMPKVKTIESNLPKYAKMVGWQLQKNPNGTYSIFDEYMQ